MVAYPCQLTKNPEREPTTVGIRLNLKTPTKHHVSAKLVESYGFIEIKLDSNVALDLIERLRSRDIMGDLKKLRIIVAFE